MLGVLIRKELLDNFYSLRFMISSIICVFVIFASVFVLKNDYEDQKRAYDNSVKKGREHIEKTDDYMQLMFTGLQTVRPPAKMQFLYTGIEKNPDRKTTIRSFLKPSFTGDFNFNPVFPLFPVIDLLFIVSVVMSLLAFVYTYDAVCGERERGTLKLLMSYSVPRDKVILAKWVGGFVSLIIPYLAGILVCSLIILLDRNLKFSGEDWRAFAMTILVALLFIAVMYSVGLFVSIISKRSATSISILLLIWVVFVLVIPNISPFVVDKIKPIDSVSTVQAKVQAASGKQMETLIFKMLDNLQAIIQRPHLAPGFTWDKLKFDSGPGSNKKRNDQMQKQGQQSSGQSAQSGGGQSSSDQGGGSASSGGQGSGSDEARKQAQSAGVDISSSMNFDAMAANVTDKDIDELDKFGCDSFIKGRLVDIQKEAQKQYGIAKEQFDALAKQYMGTIVQQCEENRRQLVADYRKHQSDTSQQSQDSGKNAQQQQAAPASSSGSKPTACVPAKKEYTVSDLLSLAKCLNDQDKADTTQGYYSGFLQSSEENMRQVNDFWKDRDRAVEAQIRLTKNISRISPVSSLVYATTDLADTGIEHDIYLRDNYLTPYQALFSKYVKDQITKPWDKMTTDSVDGMGIIRKPASPKDTISQLPVLDYKPMSLGDRIKIVLPDLFILFAFAIAFFMAAFFSFLKAEIIE